MSWGRRRTYEFKEVRENAKEKMKGVCRVYRICNGAPDRLCQSMKHGKPTGMKGVGKELSFAAKGLYFRKSKPSGLP